MRSTQALSYLKPLATALICATLAACAAAPVPTDTSNLIRKQPQTVMPPAVSQANVDSFAIAFLDSIQAESIAARREFCGYFYRDPEGQLRATEPRVGTFATCNMPAPNRFLEVFASYHTHGAYGERYDNEVPSITDIQSDVQLGLDGFISTPGGRVWRVNHLTKDTVQLCGLGCVTRDPDFVPNNEAAVLVRFSLIQLSERNGG